MCVRHARRSWFRHPGCPFSASAGWRVCSITRSPVASHLGQKVPDQRPRRAPPNDAWRDGSNRPSTLAVVGLHQFGTGKVLWRATGWAAANWLLDAATLALIAVAVGGNVPLSGLLLAYIFGQLVAAARSLPVALGQSLDPHRDRSASAPDPADWREGRCGAVAVNARHSALNWRGRSPL